MILKESAVSLPDAANYVLGYCLKQKFSKRMT